LSLLAGLWLKAGEVVEEGKVGLNAQKSFAKMDKYCNMCDRIRVKMVELKTIIVKKATQEVSGGGGQSPFNEMLE
jgi:hypothetical protein